MKKITVGGKIAAVLGMAMVVLLFVGLQSHRNTTQLIKATEWVEHTLLVREGIARVLADLHMAETFQRGYLLTEEARYRKAYETAQEAVAEHLDSLQQLTRDNHNQQRRLVTLRALITKRMARLSEGIKIRLENGLGAAGQYVSTGDGETMMTRIRTLCDNMNDEENALLIARSETSRKSCRFALGTLSYGVPAAVLFLVVIGFLLTRNITRPLKTVTVIAENMAEGDVVLADIPHEERSDELGMLLKAFRRMASFQRDMAQVAGQIAHGDLQVEVVPLSSRDLLGNAFATMVDKLKRLTSDLAAAAKVMYSAATEIATSTTQLSASATETATAVTETTATVSEVRQTAQVSSQQAKEVSGGAEKSAGISRAGTTSTGEMVEGMKHIHKQMTLIGESMASLSEQTQAIGQIIAVVDDLSAQSNLLAVNAAIEAAKAGEQGKGFTVVAQEVKNLAEQSKQATGQVRTILGDIQKATSAAVLATEQGTRTVEDGVQQSTRAGEAIQALAERLRDSMAAATQIAASNQQQLVGVDQVALAMANIKQATAQNAANAKQLETSARELNELGRNLEHLLGEYRT